jgi:anti-anti-sigma factor
MTYGRQGRFAITTDEEGGRTRLTVWGELDLESAPILEEELAEARTVRRELILDLSRVDFIDARGVNALVQTIEHSRSNGWHFEVAPAVSDQVRRMFEILRMPFPP